MLLILLSYVALNAVALAMFGVDKGMAMGGGRRISERTLLAAALCGPFGAYAGMKLFRHKTRKHIFLLVPLFLISHSILIVYFFIIT